MLSNTATPKYYGEFRDKVLSGEIPINQEIALEMTRIDAMIDNPRYYYDDTAIDGFIRFCENELTLTDGSPVQLLDTFKLWAESIFSWYHFVEKKVFVKDSDSDFGGRMVTKKVLQRLRRKQYLIVARGAAKSMYMSFVQMYTLVTNTGTAHHVTTAPTMKQAEEIMSPIRTAMTRPPGPVIKFLTQGSIQNTTGNRADRPKLASTKKGIEYFLTGSMLEVRPMSIDKLQGLRVKVATVDEWLSGDVREDVVGALEQGASKNDDYLILAVSSEGTVRNAVGDSVKMELMKILRGEYSAPEVSIWYYRLDDVEEVGDPSMWMKAQPNIGITVSYDVYQQDVERAENSPSARNDILAKRFGIPMAGHTYFFTYDETLTHPESNYDGMECVMGADLSQGDDFCAFTFMFPLRDGTFGVKTRCYISSLSLHRAPPAVRMKYEEFMKEGSLQVLECNVLDMQEVFDDLLGYMNQHGYHPMVMGYDPYGSEVFVKNWTNFYGPHNIHKVIQGARTESVPLGKLKILSEERALRFDQALFSYAMGNCVAIEDTNGNRKLSKSRHEQKIDAVAALLDAYIAYLRQPEYYLT